MQGRAVQSIPSLLTKFFDGFSFDDVETLLSDLLQLYISPDPNSVHSTKQIANTVFTVREINNLLRHLELIHNSIEGGSHE